MTNLTVAELLQITEGTLVAGNPAQPAGRLCSDTRRLQPGETFLALSGPNFRGEDFLTTAMGLGAGGAITHHGTTSGGFAAHHFHVQVSDTQVALGDIARAWRHRMNARIVATSGSAGKTTTKEMLHHIVAASHDSIATLGNLNNLIGLPQTLLRLEPKHTVAVIELGMNVPGELHRLTEIGDPDIAVLTNIGNAHIGNFGSLEGLIRGEGELLAAMRPDATLLLNADCPNTARLGEFYPAHPNVVRYGLTPSADVFASGITPRGEVGYEFTLHVGGESARVAIGLYGRFQVYNVVAAAAAAHLLGIPTTEIAARLESFQPPKFRTQIEHLDGVLAIVDCYNASPDAMEKSVRSMADLAGIHRRIAMLGDMNELGSLAEHHHRAVGRMMREGRVDLLCTRGRMVGWMAEEARAQGVEVMHFESDEEAASFLAAELRPHDALLVKASRTLGFENIYKRFGELRRGRMQEASTHA